MLQPGERFGRYELAELLGKGGMGEVYSAYDTLLHRRVALKVLILPPSLPGEGSASSKGAARILREARAAAGITHPNAVSIYDVGEIDGVSFLAMELVAGRTLRAFIGDPGVSIARRIRWVADVARALGAAHKLGLVHRDIKPENVMVRDDDGFVKVLDFGIARRALPTDAVAPSTMATTADAAMLEKYAAHQATLTADGVVAGTPMYMAPEQMRGESLDGRADQFSWGVLAHEVITGRLPWDAHGLAVLSQILSKEVHSIQERFPQVPARVDAVICKALSKSREGRFRAMEEIVDELEPFSASHGAASRRPDDVSLPPASSALALAPTEHGAISTGASTRTGSPAATHPVTEGARRGRRPGWVAAVAVGVVALAGALGVSRLVSSRHAARAPLDSAPPAEAPSQMSANPEAAAAYRAGAQALHDASLGSGMKQLERSIELDPFFAAAHLRLAVAKIVADEPLTSADLEGVRNSRASLGERDRTLLDAFESWTLDPPDYKESERRLQAAVKRFPSDAEVPFALGLVLDKQQSPESAAAFDLAVARDPAFALAWMAKGELALAAGDEARGQEAYKQCLKVSPGATTCLSDLAALESNEGKCEDLTRLSRRLIELVPDAPVAYQRLAEGLLGSGEPIDAVRAVLKQRSEHQPPADRPIAGLFDDAVLALLTGDFAAAQRRYGELDQLTRSGSDPTLKFEIAYPRVLLALEIGHLAEANRLAESYLRQSAAWADGSYDQSLSVEAAELEANGIDRAKFDLVRDRWLARNGGVSPGNRWIEAFAVAVRTREEAVSALAAKPDVHPLITPLMSAPEFLEPVGRTYALAGRADEAAPYLVQAATMCAVVRGEAVIFSTWAALRLGGALEARGDKEGACSAYRRVLARWGAPTGASRSAVMAIERTRALGCSP